MRPPSPSRGWRTSATSGSARTWRSAPCVASGGAFRPLAPRIAKLDHLGGRPSATSSIAATRSSAARASVRFLEMEYGIPLDAVPEAIGRIDALVRTASVPAVVPDRGAGVGGRRHPAVDRERSRVGVDRVHQYIGAPYEAYFQGVEQIMNDYDGRPHWGKLHFQSSHTLAHRYPEWDVFRAVEPNSTPPAPSATRTSTGSSASRSEVVHRCQAPMHDLHVRSVKSWLIQIESSTWKPWRA